MRVVSRQVFVPSPGPGVGVGGAAYYTRAAGHELISIHTHHTRSDTADAAVYRRSPDGGATWGPATEAATGERRPEGTWRRYPRAGHVDAATDRYVTVRVEGVLPTDEPLEGMRQWMLHYTVSADGGRTDLVDEPIIHAGSDADGAAFNADHPLPGVWRGRAGVMLGDLTCVPLTLRGGSDAGDILTPCQICPVGPDGVFVNKGGGFTFHDSAVLHGRWIDGGPRLSWRLSERVIGDPERSTRGFLEATIAEVTPGRVLMVMRGSNDVRPELPGYRWYAISEDSGWTFGPVRPWTDTDGEPLHSPSACSQLLDHSGGRLFWIGNLCRGNPRGNGPRYPIVIAEVERERGLLRRDTVTVIDDRQLGESERLTLSNFYAREERGSGDVLLYLPRYYARPGSAGNFEADNMVYRIAVTSGGRDE